MSDDPEPDDGKVVPLVAKPRRPCPICRRPAVTQYRPFCSARCGQVDLGRWFTGNYRIPTDQYPEDGEPPADEDGQAE
jgi:endogenous inhibitor of DNA gyrase (YacG/DUF329 family)